MHNLESLLAAYVWASCWLVLLLAGAAWLADRLLRSVSVSVLHRIWVVAVAAAVLLPALPTVRRELRTHAGAEGQRALVRILVGNEADEGGGLRALRLSPFALAMVCCGYAGLTGYFGVRFMVGLRRTAKLVGKAQPCALPEQLAASFAQLCAAYGTSCAVLVSAQVGGPTTVSWPRPMLLLPDTFLEDARREDFCAAAAHELAHVVRRDFEKNLCLEVVFLPLLFHPAAWWMKRRLAQTRELLCDEIAAQHVGGGRRYARSLLRLAAMVASPGAAPCHPIGIFDANILEERVMALEQTKSPMSWVRRSALLTASAACLVVPLAAAAAAPALFDVDAGAATAGPDKVYTVGGEVSAPMLVSSKEPVYPQAELKSGSDRGGVCVVALVVDTVGRPQQVRMVRSLGKDFDASAIAAVEQYRFAPAKRAGMAVPVELKIEVNFQKH